jgi:hypothetical protein
MKRYVFLIAAMCFALTATVARAGCETGSAMAESARQSAEDEQKSWEEARNQQDEIANGLKSCIKLVRNTCLGSLFGSLPQMIGGGGISWCGMNLFGSVDACKLAQAAMRKAGVVGTESILAKINGGKHDVSIFGTKVGSAGVDGSAGTGSAAPSVTNTTSIGTPSVGTSGTSTVQSAIQNARTSNANPYN